MEGAPASGALAIESREDYNARVKRERDERNKADKIVNAQRGLASQLLKKLSGPLASLSEALQNKHIQALNKDLVKASIDAKDAAADEEAKLEAAIRAPSADYDPSTQKEASMCCAGLALVNG